MNTGVDDKKSVLIVDDDQTLRDAIVFDFKRRGYRVFAAADGVEAFEIVKTERVDAVITDVRMPNGSGIELLDNIKQFSINIPVVIFITGFMDLTLEEAYDKGACVVMSKPFDRKLLIEAVQRSLLDRMEKFSKPVDTPGFDLEVQLKSQEGSSLAPEKMVAIGQGGVFIMSERPEAKLNQTVLFKIEGPAEALPFISGHGIVRWIRPMASGELASGLGIEFVFLDESCRKDVVDFLDGLKVKAFIPKIA